MTATQEAIETIQEAVVVGLAGIVTTGVTCVRAISNGATATEAIISGVQAGIRVVGEYMIAGVSGALAIAYNTIRH
jgi:hypothetical protein